MTIERGLGSTSPIHVHVDEVTPVHVHVKKPKKSSTAKAVEERLTRSRLRSAQSFGNGNLRSTTRRSTATAQSRSKSPAGGPWVPAPGKTSRNQVSWQGPSHRLEISGPQDDMIHSTLRRSELSTDEEDRVQGHMRGYEKKIDSLMTEVGTLKNEVDLQRTLRDIERKDEALHDTRAALEDQEHEIIDYRRELEATDGENRVLRHSLSRLKDEVSASKGTASALASDRDQLMKVLVEAEMDGQAASKQVSALRDSVRRLREEKRMSSTDTAMLAKQKELLMTRLEDFENTNRTLRRLLREQHKQEASGLRLAEQRDVLLKKLAETEDDNQRLRIDVIERDRLLNEVRLQATAQRDENLALSGVQSSLEQTRGHLQKQLKTKEADCNRMAVQIRGLESQLAQEKIEVDHLQELLEAAKEKAERDKDALKKATRVQKQRAARSQDAVEQMNTQLLERETILAQLEDDLHVNRARTEKVAKEKSQVLAENSALKNRLSEIEGLLHRTEEDYKGQVERLTADLHNKTSESGIHKLENERLKTSIANIEDKLSQADTEVTALKSSLRKYETLVDEYKSQMNKSRREADEVSVRLEESVRETRHIEKDSEINLEKVKLRLQNRLLELEPLPELLKTTELRLQDANDRIIGYEQRNTENAKLIAELTVKLEHKTENLESIKEKIHDIQDENRTLKAQLETLDRRQKDIDEQNRHLNESMGKKEEANNQYNLRIDELKRENSSLTRQLETALSETRRLAEDNREKAASKERAIQSRLLELESQLSQGRADIARYKREKEEAERKCNSRLYDLKDRLEQSHSTNRSMQNYVQFLKSSYANVFGDTSISGGLPASSPFKSSLH